jgi:hypothetical protein
MPLALVRFALQSFPLENSIALSSNTITQLELYKKALLIRRYVQLLTYSPYQVLIRFRVRSHPVLVLPSTGGRYSLGSVMPSREHHQSTPARKNLPLLYLDPFASKPGPYFRVLRINQPEPSPKRRFIPYRLSTLLH